MSQRNPFTKFEIRDIPPERTSCDALFDSRFLRVHALNGRPAVVTIERVQELRSSAENGETKMQPLITLKEFEKPWACNVTNKDMLKMHFGDQWPDWLGKRIELYPTKTRFGREVVDCMRVRDKLPDAAPRANVGNVERRVVGKLSEAVKKHLDSMGAAQDADQLDACSEALVADDTLTEAETTFLGRALEKRRGQIREEAL